MLDVGTRAAVVGINRRARYACVDDACELEHFFAAAPMPVTGARLAVVEPGGRYHYVDDAPSARGGTVIGHEPGGRIDHDFRHQLLLDDFSVVTADALDVIEHDAPARTLPERPPFAPQTMTQFGFSMDTAWSIVRGSGGMSVDEVHTALRPLSGGATTPGFANVPRQNVAQVVTANTNRDGTGTIADILTGVAAGTKIEEVVLQSDGDPADSIVTLFLYNGTNYRIIDEFDMGNPAAGSTTVSAYRTRKAYDSLYLPTASWKISAAITVALTAGNVNAWAAGADF